jgi:hypothetical protein
MEAITCIREGETLQGLNYDSIQQVSVGERADYSARQCKRIVKQFIIEVGRALGEI